MLSRSLKFRRIPGFRKVQAYRAITAAERYWAARPGQVIAALERWWAARLGQSFGCRVRDRGTTTAEYAIVMLAAVAFAGLMMAILRSGPVRALLLGIIQRALDV